MERWQGRVAMVTGASAGIGAAIAVALVQRGMKVVGVARRADRVLELKNTLGSLKDNLHVVQVNLTSEEDILRAFKWAREHLGGVDVLVNNAGVFTDSLISEASTDEWRRMLDVNILALSICTREAIKGLREDGVDDGHIIHISSIAGVNPPYSGHTAFYGATKHAVQALTEGLRKDLVARGSKIRVTTICPGLVKTEILQDNKFMSPDVYEQRPYLNSEDIADAVIYALQVPPHVQIHEMIVKPVGEPV